SPVASIELPTLPSASSASPESSTPTSGAPITPSPSTQATASAPATASASVSATPNATATLAPLLLDWQQVARPGLGAAEDIVGSAANGGRMVAIGEDEETDDAAWYSDNGRDWTKATVNSTLNGLALHDVSANGDGFVAVGTFYADNGFTGIALTSA